MLKFDKVNAFWVGLYVASNMVEDVIESRRAARVAAVNADFDERERMLRAHIVELEAVRDQAAKDMEEDDLSWM